MKKRTTAETIPPIGATDIEKTTPSHHRDTENTEKGDTPKLPTVRNGGGVRPWSREPAVQSPRAAAIVIWSHALCGP